MTTTRILHLSDTHLMAGGALHHGAVDTHASLRLLLEGAAALRDLDLVVCTGDLSDDGTPESYELLRDTVEPWAAERGARVLYAMGNHDLAEGFEAVLGERHAMHDIAGLRVITLDTTVPMAGYGMLGADDLARLRRELAEPAPRGTVLVLHHAPVPARTELLQALALQNPPALAEALAGGDVRLILAGHYHHLLVDDFAGARVVVAPAVANSADPIGDPAVETTRRGRGAVLHEVGEEGIRSVPFAVAADDDGQLVSLLDRARVAEIIELAGPPAGV